jgi:hypothetical protein
VRLAALGRLTDARSLASLARKSEHPSVRLQALGAIEDQAVLLDLALKSEHKDVAVAALERLTDDAALATVVEKGRNKASVRRARALLDERRPPEAAPEIESADEPAHERPVAVAEVAVAAPPAAPAVAPEAEQRDALCRRVERMTGDVVATELPALREDLGRAVRLGRAEAAVFAKRFEQAAKAAEDRAARLLAILARRERLEALVGEIESAADAEEPAAARAHLASLKTEWTDLATDAMTPEIEQRRAAAETRLGEREARSREEDAKVATDNLARLTALTDKLEALAKLETLALRDAEQGLRDVKAALDAPGPGARAARSAKRSSSGCAPCGRRSSHGRRSCARPTSGRAGRTCRSRKSCACWWRRSRPRRTSTGGAQAARPRRALEGGAPGTEGRGRGAVAPLQGRARPDLREDPVALRRARDAGRPRT